MANNPPLALNRLSTEGDIIDFYKNGSTIGSISIAGTDDIALYSSATNHTGLRLGTDIVVPTNNAGSPSDNVRIWFIIFSLQRPLPFR